MSNVLKLKICKHRKFKVEESYKGFYNPFTKKFTLLDDWLKWVNDNPESVRASYEAIEFKGVCLDECKNKVTLITNLEKVGLKNIHPGDTIEVVDKDIKVISSPMNKQKHETSKRNNSNNEVRKSVTRLKRMMGR